MTDYHSVLVCAESVGGTMAHIAGELMTVGARLAAELSQPLCVLVIGPDAGNAASEARSMGADKVLTVNAPPFLDATPEHYVTLLDHACLRAQPSVVLIAQGDMGRDVAPRLAAKMKATVTMDCIDIAVDAATSELLVTKPVYGGNAIAQWASSCLPHVITLRPGSAPRATPDPARQGEITALELPSDEVNTTRLLETAKDESTGVTLEDARAIVAGGAGMGNKEGLSMVGELARVLGATVGVTRVPCDLGWAPISMEIGQTGHIVSPDLYIAVGISGAPQHIAGCLGSKTIVAINRDGEANIFKVADFGVVGDYRQVLPPLIERLRVVKSG